MASMRGSPRGRERVGVLSNGLGGFIVTSGEVVVLGRRRRRVSELGWIGSGLSSPVYRVPGSIPSVERVIVDEWSKK